MQENKIAQWKEAIATWEDFIKNEEGTIEMRKQWQEGIETYEELIAESEENNIEGSKEIRVDRKSVV
jgi:hypothetical protein